MKHFQVSVTSSGLSLSHTMKREVIRAKMPEDVIQKVSVLRKNMSSETVSTQDMIEDVSQHGVQLHVMTSDLVQDVIQRETRLEMWTDK